MEAALCLGYGPLPSISLLMPSLTIATPASLKLHLGFNRSSISVSGAGFTNGRRCRHFYGPGPIALERSNSSMPSGKEKGVVKVFVAGAIGASLALTCALSITGCGCKMNLKSIACTMPPLTMEDSPSPWQKKALEPLLNMTKNLASEEGRKMWPVDLDPLEWLRSLDLSSSTHEPSTDQIDELKKKAVSMMKHGQPHGKAVSLVKKVYEKYKPKSSENESPAAYDLKMALVEILICQGEYNEAYKFIGDQDQNNQFSDYRPILYKAILCTMLNKEKAQQLWEDFAKSPEERKEGDKVDIVKENKKTDSRLQGKSN